MKKTIFACVLALALTLAGVCVHADGIVLPVDDFTSVSVSVTATTMPEGVAAPAGYDWANAAVWRVRAIRNNQTITPSQALDVSLTPPAGADASRCAVFLISGSTATLVSSSLSGGKRKMTTKTMGVYAVAARIVAGKGDVNEDGAVTEADRMQLSRYLAGWDVSEPTLATGDINGDGEISAIDRAILARYLADWGEPYDSYFAN